MSSEDIEVVVAVRRNGEIKWYRSDRDLWVLDVNKWRDEFIENGYEVPEFNDSYRFGICVVDESTVNNFLDKMSRFEVSRDDLSIDLARRFATAASWWDVQDLFPIMFVDFDNKRVAGFYPEGTPLERYVPDGWSGEFVDFANEYPENIFPREQKFWIKGDSDLLALLNERAKE